MRRPVALDDSATGARKAAPESCRGALSRNQTRLLRRWPVRRTACSRRGLFRLSENSAHEHYVARPCAAYRLTWQLPDLDSLTRRGGDVANICGGVRTP